MASPLMLAPWGQSSFIIPSCLYAKSCPTVVTLWTVSLPGSSVHGIPQVRILEWVTALLQGILLTQGLNPYILRLLHW